MKIKSEVNYGAQSLWQIAIKNLKRNRMAMVGLYTLLTMLVLVIIGPLLSPYEYDEQSLEHQYSPPSLHHPFGTDLKGRDLLTRVLYGGRISFMVGFLATLVSIIIGVSYGAVAGYAGGRLDNLMMRFVDILYSLPYMVYVILLIVFFGRNIFNLFIALGAVQWLTMSRIVRGQVLSIREKEFIEAVRALGASNLRIIAAHVIPNILGPVIVYTTLTVPAVMLEEAFLSFLGLGVQPPSCSWGSLAAVGAESINPLKISWWLILFPGLALAATLFSLNFLGDGLRDALDPRLKGTGTVR
jgi:oligopeptide transport system permease protein